MTTISDSEKIDSIRLKTQSSPPAAPPSGYGQLFRGADGALAQVEHDATVLHVPAVSGTPANVGDTLAYDGTKYVPQAPSGAGFAVETATLANAAAGNSNYPAVFGQTPLWNDGYTIGSDDDLHVPVAGRFHYDLVLALLNDTSTLPHHLRPRLEGQTPSDNLDLVVTPVGADEQRYHFGGEFTAAPTDQLFVACGHDGNGAITFTLRLYLTLLKAA